MLTRRHMLGSLLTLPVLATPALALPGPVFLTDRFAAHGMDPVAYFTKNAAVPGRAEHQLRWLGAIWQFESRENQIAFEGNPFAFAPKYGGYCAYSMASGELSETDPEIFSFHNDQLYLNSSILVRAAWDANADANVKLANQHWSEIDFG